MLRNSLLISIIVSTIFQSISATNYYFSASIGRDTNTGTSPSSPWQTIAKYTSTLAGRLQSGDNVYFCQGDTWLYSSIKSASNGVTFDSYQCRNGQTAKPVISAAVQPAAAAWTRIGNSNIIQANLKTGSYADPIAVSDGVKAIWIDKVRYVPARYPNLLNPVNNQTIGQVTWGLDGEFLRATSSSGATLYCAQLTQPTNFWVGSQVYVRVLNYAYLPYNVIASGPGFITLHAAPGQAAGFYFSQQSGVPASNNFLQVDNPGEYSFDKSTGILTLYPLSTTIMNNILTGSQPVSMLYSSASAAFVQGDGITQITVQNLHFRWSPIGISSTSNGVMNVKYNDISNIAGSGFSNTRVAQLTITNNNVFDCESTGIAAQTSLLIAYNTITQAGLYAGWGVWQAGNGLASVGGTVQFNTIQYVGYCGIMPTGRAFVTYNVVDWAMMALNDGGGIYGYGSGMVGVAIYSNTVTNMVGNYVSWTPWPIAPCYYLDTTSYVSLYNSTCTKAPSCVQLNSGMGHLIYLNTCNAPGMYVNQATGQSTFMGNLVATTGTDNRLQNPLHRVQAPTISQYSNIMSTADNVYCIPAAAYSNYLFQMVVQGVNARYNQFTQWRDAVTPQVPTWERGSVVYASCAGIRATFVANDVLSGPSNVRFQTESKDSSTTAVVVSVAVVSAVLLAVAVVFAIRFYRANKNSSELSIPHPAEIEISLTAIQSAPTPTSASASSFNIMPSTPSHSVV